ncbi:MAG: 30S ribosomal protein S20 [Deltaproteobacteria bacterium]|nr:30S ribosomal protein S20 [Deltaproteobacteria bacterium]
MANHKSALKRARQNIKRNLRNNSLTSALRTALKAFSKKIESKDVKNGQEDLSKVHQSIDKAVSKGILHKNAAARKKSRAALALKKVGAA